MTIVKAVAIWCLILGCAVLNGLFREAVLLPRLGQPYAQVLSGLLLSLCILAVSIALIPWLGRLDAARSLQLGGMWLAMTLAFEFALGRLIQHRSWPEVFEPYTFKDGNLWPVVLVVTFLAPLVATRIRKIGL